MAADDAVKTDAHASLSGLSQAMLRGAKMAKIKIERILIPICWSRQPRKPSIKSQTGLVERVYGQGKAFKYENLNPKRSCSSEKLPNLEKTLAVRIPQMIETIWRKSYNEEANDF
jgi:hypothetical protein